MGVSEIFYNYVKDQGELPYLAKFGSKCYKTTKLTL